MPRGKRFFWNMYQHGFETFSCSAYAGHEIIFADKYENANNSRHFIFISRKRNHAQLCLAGKNV